MTATWMLQTAHLADEPALARAFAARERSAFDDAYRRYGSLLYSVAYNVLHNAEDAQDCVHDVLVRTWQTSTYNTGRGSVRTFLVVCVRNEAVSRVRSAQRLARLGERVARETPVTEYFEIGDFVENRRLHAAIERLPVEQRAPVLLTYFCGRTHIEVARELREPLGTVKSRISLGLRKLGAALREEQS